MEDNKKDNRLFSEQLSKDRLDFLKIGSTFTNQPSKNDEKKDKDKISTYKKKAVDYFDSSEEDNDKPEIKYTQLNDEELEKNDEISDFSDSRKRIVSTSQKNNKMSKEKQSKKDRIVNRFLLGIYLAKIRH